MTVEDCLDGIDDRLHEIALSLAGSHVDANIASSIDSLAESNEHISNSLDCVADSLQAIAKAMESIGKRAA